MPSMLLKTKLYDYACWLSLSSTPDVIPTAGSIDLEVRIYFYVVYVPYYMLDNLSVRAVYRNAMSPLRCKMK